MAHEREIRTETSKEEIKERFMAMAGLIGPFGAGSFTGEKAEKLAVSLNAAEAAEIDQLIVQGLYASREDFLQTAARHLLRDHGVTVQPPVRHLTVAGMAMHTRNSLEKLQASGQQLDISVAGIFRLADDVTPALASAVIQSLKIRGSFHASAEVKAALKDRMS